MAANSLIRRVCSRFYAQNGNISVRLLFSNGDMSEGSRFCRRQATLPKLTGSVTGTLSTRSIHSLASLAHHHAGLTYHRRQPYATDLHQNCWKCGTEIDPEGEQYFCECGVIQPPIEERNYFEVFGLQLSFDIETADLTQRFRDLQRQLHPDRFTQKSESEKGFSADQSSTVNRAYQTLLKPLPRALYLLQLRGYNIEDGTTEEDPEFLMEIMEINETLAENIPIEEIRKIGRLNQKSLRKLTDKLSQAFSDDDVVKAKHLLSHLKYYANIDDKVRDFERKQSD